MSAVSARPTSSVDIARAGRTASLACVVIAGLFCLGVNGSSGRYGFDLHGILRGAHAMLSGRNPYPPAHVSRLVATGNPYVLPPLLGLLASPLSFVPFPLAIVVGNLVCIAAMITALRLLDVRDWRVYLMALLSLPFVASLGMGQPDGLFALGAAFAWRQRANWRGAATVGLLIAAKLLAWPLVLWLVYTRRFRLALVAVATSATLLLGSWLAIGFDGLGSYAALLKADARGFEMRSHSVVALLMQLGAPAGLSLAIAAAVAGALAVVLVRSASDLDHAAFTAAILAALLLSPIMWSHYIVLLFVPLAIRHRRLDLSWLLLAPMWLSPNEPADPTQIGLVLALTLAVALSAVRPERAEPQLTVPGFAPAAQL